MSIPQSGLYIVTLNNEQPISVNAQDPRVADRAIKVTRDNCKFGKAKVLTNRMNNYYKTFGIENVNYYPIVAIEDISTPEKYILRELIPYRIRGKSGHMNEWLENISPYQVEDLILRSLIKLNLPFVQIGSVNDEK